MGGLWSALLLIVVPARCQFSHRIHLAQKIDCIVCHTAAPSSKTAADVLLPKREMCGGCHEGMEVVIKQPATLTVSKFNHALHVKLAPTIAPTLLKAIAAKAYLSDPGDLASQLQGAKHACTGCHRGLDKSNAITEAAFPRMADCLVCHNTIDPPFSCEKCHAADAKLKPASHANDWIDRHSTGKVLTATDRQSCAVCHGRTFTCQGCH